ncbi:MAG: phosphatase PAP2 family protein [Candidatus Zixiibacteriota bacterium]
MNFFHPLIERAIQLDTSLFYLLNSKVQNAALDFLMPILTNLDYWRIPLALFAVALFIFGKKRGRIAVVLLIFGITLSDQICNTLIKPLVGRVRPCTVLQNVRLLVGCTQSFSFPSSHATNIFTGMTILSSVYRKLKPVLLTIAVLVAYSRVYVGVHYPFDIIGGAVLGVLCALTIIDVYKSLSRRFQGISYAEDIRQNQNQPNPR